MTEDNGKILYFCLHLFLYKWLVVDYSTMVCHRVHQGFLLYGSSVSVVAALLIRAAKLRCAKLDHGKLSPAHKHGKASAPVLIPQTWPSRISDALSLASLMLVKHQLK